MITKIDLPQEILAIDVFTALVSFLEHRCKNVLRLLGLYGDQAPIPAPIVFDQLCGSRGIKNDQIRLSNSTTADYFPVPVPNILF